MVRGPRQSHRSLRVQYLSDLHFEFHADAGASFVESMDPSDVDVLVIAGDLATGRGIGPALDRFCARYAGIPVVYVHGNHEYYGCARDEARAATRAACRRHPTLHWLDADGTTIGGRRILGATLWFRRSKHADLEDRMNDFQQIPNFEGWVYDDNARALAFFDRELRTGDLVITHHLPAAACVGSRWKSSPLNPFFVCDLEPLIRTRKPSTWIHGHMHDSVDVRVGHTRIVCNPFGYVGHELNAVFDDKAVVEV